MQAISYKVSLIGSTGSGKSKFLEKLLNIEISYPTVGVNVYNYSLSLNNVKYRFNFWDCAGDSRYQGLGSEYIKDSDYVLIFGQDSSFEDWIPNNIPFKYILNPDNIDLNEILIELTTEN